MADLRLRRPAHASRPGLETATASVPRAVAAEGPSRHRVPTVRRVRKGLRRPAEGALLRDQRADGEDHLDEALLALRGRLTDDSRRRSSTRPICTRFPARSTLALRGGSSSPGTRGTAASSGGWRQGPSSRPRLSSARPSTSARGITASTRTPSGASASRACAGRSPRTTRWWPRPPTRTPASSSQRAAGASTRSMRAPGGSAGAPPRSRISGGASTSTPRPRSPTAASSSATRTGRCTPSVRAAATCSGRGMSARTSTPPPRSGGRPSSSVPGTGTSSRSTPARGTCAGASRPPRRSPALRQCWRVSSTSRRADAAAWAVSGA